MFPTANEWYYVVVTYDGSSGEQAVYVDGALTTTGTTSYPYCGTTTGSLVIGQEQDSYGGGFDIDQTPGMYHGTMAVYERAWDASEVEASKTCVDESDPDRGDLGEAFFRPLE